MLVKEKPRGLGTVLGRGHDEKTEVRRINYSE